VDASISPGGFDIFLLVADKREEGCVYGSSAESVKIRLLLCLGSLRGLMIIMR